MQVNAFLDIIDKGDNVTNPEPKVVVIEGAHGTGKVSTVSANLCHAVSG